MALTSKEPFAVFATKYKKILKSKTEGRNAFRKALVEEYKIAQEEYRKRAAELQTSGAFIKAKALEQERRAMENERQAILKAAQMNPRSRGYYDPEEDQKPGVEEPREDLTYMGIRYVQLKNPVCPLCALTLRVAEQRRTYLCPNCNFEMPESAIERFRSSMRNNVRELPGARSQPERREAPPEPDTKIRKIVLEEEPA